jgi:hypothetical protein
MHSANPAGNATGKQRVTLPLTSIESIGICQRPANTQGACASVPR